MTILQNVYSDFIADIIRHFFRTLVKLLTTLIIGRIVFHRLLTHLKLLIAAVVGCKRLKCAYPMIIQGQFGLTTLRYGLVRFEFDESIRKLFKCPASELQIRISE